MHFHDQLRIEGGSRFHLINLHPTHFEVSISITILFKEFLHFIVNPLNLSKNYWTGVYPLMLGNRYLLIIIININIIIIIIMLLMRANIVVTTGAIN